jgi:DHA1 family bicyclomycin/chloramphenicol resistance-like MFS transporter
VSRSIESGHRPPVLALIAVSALSPFAINVILPSLPAMEVAFVAGYSRVQLTVSLYLAAVALSQVVIGPISDRLGRRPVLLVGFGIFALASAASPFSPAVEALIGWRIVQGASACVGIVMGRAIVRDLFERRQAASMIGYITMGYATAPMVAPLIGGLFQEAFGWQAIFWFMAALGGGCFAVAWRFIPETNRSPSERLNIGALRGDFVGLVRDTDFLLFTASGSLSSGLFFAFLGGMPYVAERVLGLEPATYGLWFGLIPIGYASGNFLSGRFTERIGLVRMILGGSVLGVLASLIPFLLMALGVHGPSALFLPIVVAVLANGLVLPSSIAGALSVKPEIAGTAAGLSGAAQVGVGAIVTALAGAAVAGGTTAIPMLLIMVASAALGLLTAIVIRARRRR